MALFVAYSALFSANTSIAQRSSFAYVAASFGVAGNLNYLPGRSRLTAYPEIEMYAPILEVPRFGIVVGGSAHLGRFHYGVQDPQGCQRCVRYSHASAIVGGRARVSLESSPIVLSFSAGISEHFNRAEHVSGQGSTYLDEPVEEYYRFYTTIVYGAGLHFNVHQRFGILLNSSWHSPFSAYQHVTMLPSFVATVGVAYEL